MELQFTPYAWSKLIFFRDYNKNEVGAFGISSSENPLLVTDVRLVEQDVDSVSADFDDDGVADYFSDMVEQGLKPEEFARIWLHTHPGMSPAPSFKDKDTFKNVFGSCDWSVMCIISTDGSEYAKLNVDGRFPYTADLDVVIDYSQSFPGTDKDAWKKEYEELVTEYLPLIVTRSTGLANSKTWLEQKEDDRKAIELAELDYYEREAMDCYGNKLNDEEFERYYGYPRTLQ